MAAEKPQAINDFKLSPKAIKRIDRLVGTEHRASFVQAAVEHALFLEEHLQDQRKRTPKWKDPSI
jgi:hypothetical protein